MSAVGLLAACGGGDESASDGDPSTPADESSADTARPSPTDPPSTSEPPESDGAGDGALAATSEVPVGGGVVVDAQSVVIVQPTAGEFVAYSSVCTHQGCSVTSVADGVITCPCHGSRFAAADGSVQSGPATAPLPQVPIIVDGDAIRQG